ncbi:MAG: GNAT family N-acetyltransferase [Verrucomicrobia bacterium]|nr:GNAT family N-acetyltransferase [Verrucomicrobiota bacterium]
MADARTPTEREAVRVLLRKAFDVRPGVGEVFANLYSQVLTTPTRSRIAVSQGGVIGHALLASRQIGLAGVSLMGGIVAMVVVDQDYRGQGIGRALIQDIFALARQGGVALLQVAGDPAIYTKFGFIPAYIEASAEMDIAEATCYESLRTVRAEVMRFGVIPSTPSKPSTPSLILEKL